MKLLTLLSFLMSMGAASQVVSQETDTVNPYAFEGRDVSSHLESRTPQDLNCHNNADCQGGYCYNGICIADPPPPSQPEENLNFIPFECRKSSDCKRKPNKYCVNGFCAKFPPGLESRTPQEVSCNANVQCGDGYCYNGICVIVADPTPTSHIEARSPQDVNCHNDAECQGGYCYNGICFADPPKPVVG